MPIVTIDSDDLKALITRKITDDELKSALPLNKLSIEDWTGSCLKIEVTPDRPDLFSTEGIARQLNSWLGINPGLAKFQVSPPKTEVKVSPVALRPFITCGVVRNVRMSDRTIKSIMQLQETLDLTLGRDRKKVAIGLHDISKVTPPFFYKEIEPDGITFIPLNSSKRMSPGQVIRSHPKGMQYAHLVKAAKKWPVIVDSKNQVLSLPPIINGEATKVTEETTDMFIDITGSDEKAINYSLNILLAALEKRGGKIEAVNVGGKAKPDLSPRLMKISTDEARKTLGIDISNKEIQALLERMGYAVSVSKNGADVLVPAFRADMLHPADIIEDIAIAYGFNNLIPETPKQQSVGESDRLEDLSNRLRELMIGLGFQEVLNYTLTSKEKQFMKMDAKPEEVAEIANPVSQEYSICRRWLIPGLLEDCRSNKHRRFPQRIFETGDCVIPDKSSDTGTLNVRKLSGLATHSQAGLSEIISILNSIKEYIGIEWEMKPCKHGSFIPGRCGAVLLPTINVAIGIFGEIQPRVLVNQDLNNPAAAFELDVQKIFEAVSARAN